MLREAGLAIPDYLGQDGVQRPIRHTNEFWDNYGALVHDECRQPGDLIFFARQGIFPTHIGIVSGKETYIHAPGTSESTVESKSISFETIAAKGIARQIYTRNPIGFRSPMVRIDEPTYRYHQRLI